ncbi:MAG TPA: SpoIIE family protein phosphatase [Acidobacteriaceae bacterium]|nr:SpoIIE family protein phosphatase [Acidobacteriaceae bacterium]
MVLRTGGRWWPFWTSSVRALSETLLLACLLLPAIRIRAQVFQTPNPGIGSAAVGGPWQFHTGDDPAWANPAYNDSGWEQLRGDDTWGAQTHPGYAGFAWYRKRIEVTGSNAKLSILIPPVENAYAIYWNGRKIGSYGSLPPHAKWWAVGRSAVYPLGNVPLTGVLALRVWKAPLASNDPAEVGGLSASPLVGNPSVLMELATTPLYLREHRQLPQILIGAVVLVAGLLTLLLFLRDRTQWLYLWLGIYLLAEGLTALRVIDVVYYGLHFVSLQVYLQFVGACQDISLWLLLLTLFGFTRDRGWRRWTAVLGALYLISVIVDTTTNIFWQNAGLGMQWTDAITTAIYTLTPLYILFIVGFGLARGKQKELWPVAITAFLYGVWNFVTGILGQGPRFTHWTIVNRLNAWGLHLGSYTFSAVFLLDTLLFLVLLFTVARQQFLERRRQAQVELEIKSAQEVQQVLVPEEVPAIAGFSIASIYKPATELGGDFYQVIPLEAGDALVVVGDVSGKGLKAAMVVSLIVGTLRTLADYTQEPAEILRGLNRRLIGRTQGGFATCVAMRIEADGSGAIATAGHFSPLRNGKELPLEGALPLGITPDATYDQIAFRMQENETLIFYTDGIVEARNGQGELFGFDRVREMSRAGSSAVQVAEEASAFGQDDDITVLTLTRLAATEPALAATVKLTTQIATG